MALVVIVDGITDEQIDDFMDKKETTITGKVSMMGVRDEWIDEMVDKAEKYDNLIAEHPELEETDE